MTQRWSLTCLLILQMACTTTREIVLPAGDAEIRDLNERWRDREVELDVAEDPSTIHKTNGRSLVLRVSSARWSDSQGTQEVALPSIKSVRYLSPESPRTRGFWEGMWPGLLIGGLGGAALGPTIFSDSSCNVGAMFCFQPPTSVKVGVGAVIGAVIGAAIGGSAGAIVGHHEEVRFR